MSGPSKPGGMFSAPSPGTPGVGESVFQGVHYTPGTNPHGDVDVRPGADFSKVPTWILESAKQSEYARRRAMLGSGRFTEADSAAYDASRIHEGAMWEEILRRISTPQPQPEKPALASEAHRTDKPKYQPQGDRISMSEFDDKIRGKFSAAGIQTKAKPEASLIDAFRKAFEAWTADRPVQGGKQ